MKNKTFFFSFLFLIIQQTYSSNYAIEQSITSKSKEALASSINWVAINNNNTKIIITTNESCSLAPLKISNHLRIFDIATGLLEKEVSPFDEDKKIHQAFFHPYDRYIYIIASFDSPENSIISIYDLNKECTTSSLELINQTIKCTVLSSDEESLTVGGTKGYLTFFEPFNLIKKSQLIIKENEIVTALNFNHDSKLLISAHQKYRSSSVNLWDVKTGICIFTLKNNKSLWENNNIRSIRFDPRSEKKLIVTIKNKFFILNLKTKKVIYSYKHSTNSIGIDSEENIIILDSNGFLRKIKDHNKFVEKISTDKITFNKEMPIIPFIGIDGLERIIITSQRDDFSDQPNIKIFTKIPYFMNLQKRQFTGALSKLRKNR